MYMRKMLLFLAAAEAFRSWRTYSLQELLILALPFIYPQSFATILIILASDPTRLQLLYSALPAPYQTPISFILLLAFELTFFSSHVANGYLTTSSLVLLFQAWDHRLDNLTTKLKYTHKKTLYNASPYS